MLCYQEKVGSPHQQWMLPHFLARLLDHYSLSDIYSIYCSPSMTTEDLLMIILLLCNCERAFHHKSVVVPSCWSEESLGRKVNIEAGLPRVPLVFSKTVCSSSTQWRLWINLSSPVLFIKEVGVQSHVMLVEFRFPIRLLRLLHIQYFLVFCRTYPWIQSCSKHLA